MAALVVQSYGNDREYLRAVFTVLTFLAHSAKREHVVLLYTDQPDFFRNYFHGLPVEYITLTDSWMREMRGDIDFLHRVKIGILENAFHRYPGAIAYADSDSFFTGNPDHLLDQLEPAVSCMHKFEYTFESVRESPLPAGATLRAVSKFMDGHEFRLPDGQMIVATTQLASWNAGVMFFHPSHVKWIPDVYSITNDIFRSTGHHASEQYAFSIVLQSRTQLRSIELINYHYWYRVEKIIMDEFLKRELPESWANRPLDEKLGNARFWSQRLPKIIRHHRLTLRDKSIQAFNENRFGKGFRFGVRALIKYPFDLHFLRDIAYHTKRLLRV